MAAASTVKVRQDPKPRLVDGAKGKDRLVGADPDRKYVWANRSDASGEQYYEGLGYRVERRAANGGDGVRPWARVTCKPGEPIEMSGHVLMSIAREDADRIEREGDGDSIGQDGCDAIEKQLINRKSGMHGSDPMRGISSSVTYIAQNQTTPSVVVDVTQ